MYIFIPEMEIKKYYFSLYAKALLDESEPSNHNDDYIYSFI